ncbi:MAG: CRISPR system precrRNA processing endoribonuclease RAMP protein Cas6 [Proteobacteria bacterium]|nr:CRISPR system precrRNA processing endoribonuclease RAMP protein Cas6 [Pseudomonadota bacterium]NIS69275.1 CRISPR system precrRNA processing endoribonuclease RAMP protein Cas6 [Pseudomonadota bacterium]
MPYSLVFHCTAEADLEGDVLRGKGLRDLVLRLFDRLNPKLSQQIARTRQSPFTVSPFFAKRQPLEPKGEIHGEDYPLRGQWIEVGTRCRFRLTLLEEKLYHTLAGVVGKPDFLLSMDGKALKVNEVFSSSQETDPWPRCETYQQLRDEASPTRKELRLQFVTPTTFSRHRGTLPLPDPQMVFKRYLRSWNWFAFLPLSTDLERLIDHHIFLKDFRISAVKCVKEGGVRPAFTGWSRFILAGRHHEKHIREFNLLADYSFYCGTGDYTDMGMGVTQRL